MRTFQISVLGVALCVAFVFGPRLAAADDNSSTSVMDGPNIESAHVASDDAEALELMGAICPDGVEQTTGDFGGIVLECNSCPESASADDGRLRFQSGYIGDFSGDGTRDALVATTGCGEGHNVGRSTVVASRSSKVWEKAEYRDDIDIDNCELVEASMSHRLLCKNTVVVQEIARTQMSLRGIRDGVLSSTNLLELFDKRDSCRLEGPIVKEVSEKVIDDINGDGRTEIGLVLRTLNARIAGDAPLDDPCDKEAYDIDEDQTLRVWSVDTDGITRNSAIENSGLPPEDKDHPSPKTEKNDTDDRTTNGGCFLGGGGGSGLDLCMDDDDVFQSGF